jgi:hypothetical protein
MGEKRSACIYVLCSTIPVLSSRIGTVPPNTFMHARYAIQNALIVYLFFNIYQGPIDGLKLPRSHALCPGRVKRNVI